MTQHELDDGVRVVPKYNLDTLGAPFIVTLINSVRLRKDNSTGEEKITIPDPGGLIKAVVRSRVVHTRKLGGEDIRFIRQSLDVKAKHMADFLEMTPEHFSRCETGARVMSSASEKQFRMAAFFATVTDKPEKLFSQTTDVCSFEIDSFIAKSEENAELARHIERFIAMFFKMKIDPVFRSDEDLEIKLCWKQSATRGYVPDNRAADDGKWDIETPRAA